MSNLNVSALKRLFPKNTTRRQGGKVSGANRKRVQVMLPPDTLERLNKLIGYDEQARSAAVTLGVELLCGAMDVTPAVGDDERLVEMLGAVTEDIKDLRQFPRWLARAIDTLEP